MYEKEKRIYHIQIMKHFTFELFQEFVHRKLCSRISNLLLSAYGTVI